MSDTKSTEAAEKMAQHAMLSLQWGIKALRGQGAEHLETLRHLQSKIDTAQNAAIEAKAAVDAQIARTTDFLSHQEESLSLLNKAIQLAGGANE